MGKSITMFMWAYQESFRINLEIRAKAILQKIAPSLEPDVLLVGVRVPENSDGLPVCVEPEDGEWDTSVFSKCADRTDEIYKTHKGHNVRYGDAARTNDQPENTRRSSVSQAVKEVFDAYDESHGTKTFCSSPQRLGGYYVVCAIQLNRSQLGEYPTIDKPITLRDYTFSGGFVDFVVEKLLVEAASALWSPDPGRFDESLDRDGAALFRNAGERFCSVLTLAAGDLMFQRAFDKLNVISALRYEGTEGLGRLVVAPVGHTEVKLQIEFSEPIPLEQSGWARKILQMAHGDLCCICSGANGIRGLGELTDARAEAAFVIEFTGHFQWQLNYRGTVLLESAFGIPRLPRSMVKEATFKSTFRRLFKGVGPQDEERSWEIVRGAIRQRHGTMIVFSEIAATEAVRLRRQSTLIAPVVLSAAMVDRVSGIDGAILVDKHGVCRALGVILDGIATQAGDPARGARFNSAKRYLVSQAETPTLILVISEDGIVEMLPELRPQIARSAIQARIDRLRQCTFENFHKTREWLSRHRFYLTTEQCRIVNEEISRIEKAPRDPRVLHIETAVFEPDPDLDDSYFIPETNVCA